MSTVQLKRSAVASKVPLTTDLALGELAINTYDGLLYLKKDPGTPSIVTLVTTDATQTLSNKTLDNTSTINIKDSNLTIFDDADLTKKLVFQVSNLTTNTTVTLTAPSGSGTIATISTAQTFTNKTIGNTNTVTLKDTLFTLQDDVDTTKQLQFQISPITTGTTRTLSAPDASGTIALTSNKLSAFAATTSSELAGVISDETGSGSLVFGTSPTISGVTITSTANISANTTFTGTQILVDNGNGADEGGEIRLSAATTNSTLSGPIVIDIYQNRIRFFENGGTNRGAYIDLTAATAGAGSNLLAGVGVGTTNLTQTSNGSTVTVFSDTGTDAIILASNSTTAGILTAETQTIGGVKTFVSNTTFSANITITGAITANGSVGTAGQVLASNATATYWATLQTIQPRVVTTASATSITMNADTTDIAYMNNAQAAGTFTVNAPTGTLVNGQKLMLKLTSTNIQTFAWNAIFAGSTDASLPTASTGSSKTDYIGFIYDSAGNKWHLLAKNFGF